MRPLVLLSKSRQFHRRLRRCTRLIFLRSSSPFTVLRRLPARLCRMVKKHLVLTGGSTHHASPYATTSAVAHRSKPIVPRTPATPWMGEGQSRHGYVDTAFSSAYYVGRDWAGAAGGSRDDHG